MPRSTGRRSKRSSRNARSIGKSISQFIFNWKADRKIYWRCFEAFRYDEENLILVALNIAIKSNSWRSLTFTVSMSDLLNCKIISHDQSQRDESHDGTISLLNVLLGGLMIPTIKIHWRIQHALWWYISQATVKSPRSQSRTYECHDMVIILQGHEMTCSECLQRCWFARNTHAMWRASDKTHWRRYVDMFVSYFTVANTVCVGETVFRRRANVVANSTSFEGSFAPTPHPIEHRAIRTCLNSSPSIRRLHAAVMGAGEY